MALRSVRWLAAATAVATGALSLLAGTTATTASAAHSVAPHPYISLPINGKTLATPPTTSFCLQNFGLHCYQPSQLTKAYDLAALHDHGIDGRGKTIVIVDSFGSPTIANDLHVFDQTFGLPDPPSLTVRQDAGPVPPFDPTNSDMLGWADETTLDVEWTHVFAPGAKILLEETPVSETEGVQGFPEIVKAENYVIDHHLGDVITQSFGATEQTFPNKQSILNLRSAFQNAQDHHVTVLASSGDDGATDAQLNGSDLYTMPVNSWPSADPLVTSIGGTMLTLDDNGNRLQPDVVWNDLNTVGGGAGGGGLSTVFPRPGFQEGVRSVTGNHRGTPDISLSAAVDGAVVLYFSFDPTRVGYHLVGGTSEASPEFAGVVAMADQLAGHDLGNINGRLYALSHFRNLTGEVDVTQGNNTFGPFTNSDGTTHTVVGYNAGPGYDLASGNGTVDAARFVPALAFAPNI
ncbi:S8 family serine peptidase [Kutzneria buriramensis]|uniref:Subtilase family protein n=1 Tax=Kutzneria buriramensis TaxID=1045776 RepID=A0A3E0HHU6_9PSEU|nr:S53 family peptidase [Kutzneria buriramensis]REH45988.1 subtilase family protein [Kutzneria buriramensis]